LITCLCKKLSQRARDARLLRPCHEAETPTIMKHPKPEDFPVLVSIITPAYNAQDVLARAVASVQAQTLADWEMIIVDDSSGDATAAVAERCAQGESRIRVLRQEPAKKGAASARNTALTIAQGRYIAFLDADDEWMPDKLATQTDRMRATGAGLTYTGFLRVGADGMARRVRVPASVTLAKLRQGNRICCSSAMYDRVMTGTVPMPDLPLRQDYALWLTLLARLPRAVGIDAPLVRLHVTVGSLSSNKWRAMRATWVMHHRHFGTGVVQSAVYVASHTLRRLLRG
jgi:teichuronic acid biosynthesis glycosyltransferase TuaG